MNPSRLLLAAVFASSLLATSAFGQSELDLSDHARHHRPKAAATEKKDAAEPAKSETKDGAGTMDLSLMKDHMDRMREHLAKMREEKDEAAREKMMGEQMDMVMDHMDMMMKMMDDKNTSGGGH